MSFEMISEKRSIELIERYFPLFDYFAHNHNLTLTNSEIDDIINKVKEVLKNEVRDD